MLKALVEHIQKTAQPQVVEIEGSSFVINGNGDAIEIHPDPVCPDTLPLNSLDALVKLVRTEACEFAALPLYITIPSHLKVQCFAQPDAEKRYFRQFFYEVRATDVPGWEPDTNMDFETAQIALRTRFEKTDDQTYCMKLLTDITTGSKITRNDNGIATTIMTQKGVALQESTPIKPIVTLRPYRTFQEVEQPDGLFLIRVSERGIRFIEADGGMWKLRARETIKDFLEDELAEELENGQVLIAL